LSSSYATGSYAEEAEKVEVRAFGILVGELILRMITTKTTTKTTTTTKTMKTMTKTMTDKVGEDDKETVVISLLTESSQTEGSRAEGHATTTSNESLTVTTASDTTGSIIDSSRKVPTQSTKQQPPTPTQPTVKSNKKDPPVMKSRTIWTDMSQFTKIFTFDTHDYDSYRRTVRKGESE